MCRYCKKLKEIKDLDDNFYKEIIRSWKSHAYRMEKLLKRIESDVFLHFEYMARFFPDEEKIMALSSRYRREIRKELQKPWIGK